MKINIKNMVCPRCISSVRQILTSSGMEPTDVGLGHAILNLESITPEQWAELSSRLRAEGFELLDNSDSIICERIKTAVIGYARTEGGLRSKLSATLETDLRIPYKQLSSIFTSVEQRTIENFLISQRIEYVKELISYSIPLKEIAFITGYSSVAYLSGQFRKTVGMTPTEYRNTVNLDRSPLTEV